MTVASGTRDLVAGLMDGYLSTQLLYVAARLGLADLLANGPQSADRLAAAAGADPSSLSRILRGLAMYGLLYQAGAFSGRAGARCVMTPASCCWKSSLPTGLSISRPRC